MPSRIWSLPAPVGFDRWDLLYPLAPKPLLVMVSQRDFFGTYSPNYLTSGTEEFQKLQRVYRTLGHADQIGWFGTPLPHGFSHDLRMQIYNWFARWLKGESQPLAEEPVIQAETEETLFVSANGSMAQSFHGETPFTLNRKRSAVEDAGGPCPAAWRRSLRRAGERRNA